MAENNYDAIVIGSGISGSWAAKELTGKGLKTLLLERGHNIEHIKGYVNANKHPLGICPSWPPHTADGRRLPRAKARLPAQRTQPGF